MGRRRGPLPSLTNPLRRESAAVARWIRDGLGDRVALAKDRVVLQRRPADCQAQYWAAVVH